MSLLRSMRAALFVSSLSLAAAFGAPASAQDAGTVQLGTHRADIAEAIEAARGRRATGITMTVVGGVSVLGGIVVSAVQTQDKQDEACERERQTGYYSSYYCGGDVSFQWGGMLVGMAVGVPLIVTGVMNIVHGSRDLNRANRERRRLGYVPDADGGKLTLAWDF